MSAELRVDPAELPLKLAARVLARAENPVCLAGRGAVWGDAASALLSLCAAHPKLRVASTPGAKGVFPENHERALGVFGFGGHESALQAVNEADVLLVVGSRLFEQSSASFHPRFLRGNVIRIDRDPKVESRRAGDIVLHGDARHVLERLNTKLRIGMHRPGTAAGDSAPASTTPVRRAIASYAGPFSVDRHVKPQAFLGALSRLAAAVPVTADAGTSMCWAIEHLERVRARDFQVSVDWGTMGFALPAAIGISLARNGTPAIALVGVGAMAMYGGDLHTAVELEIPLIVCVLNDQGASMVRAGSAAWFGPNAIPDPDYRYRINFAQYGRALGAHAEIVTELAECEDALRAALARPTPTVLDIVIDPSEVPAAVTQRVAGLKSPDAPAEGREGGGMC